MLTARNPPHTSSRNLNLASHPAPGNTGHFSASMATNETPELSACSTPTATAKVFPQSSFFQERRAPALPSPAEIRTLNEASGDYRAASFNRPSPVLIPSMGLAVKYGADITIAEVEAQVFMFDRLQGRVPVPEVFGWAEGGGQYFLYMSLIEGDTLQARCSTMNESERQAVCKELRSMVNAWRALTQEPDRYIGGVGKRPLNDIFVVGHVDRGRDGPFLGADAVQEFHDICGIDIGGDIPITFTHNDLCPPNILVSYGPNPKVVGIIDWAQSGWYPSYWEYCKARRVGVVDEDFNFAVAEESHTIYQPEVIDPVDNEMFYHPWLYFMLANI
ncbi:kinase-like domain-containing protein [Emericellopsis atlantica]|uniref:Kinase-like domain-containing protein n=1 Tax=Emericellopsis atlantica TaxID=2614577 RepID=A0A9P8CPV5_9HYPO|nr:kinase-like domain-containing protein [Emericellopsis atlantica]KAG9254520.1 kinase-like domain-containing protein [Emericellopsis atlantica]